jgi:hypothetical protein
MNVEPEEKTLLYMRSGGRVARRNTCSLSLPESASQLEHVDTRVL